MALIIEGPDAAGKTTLARQLVKMGMRLIVAGGAPRTPNAVREYCEQQILACHDDANVIDRVTPISHPIYNPAYQHDDALMAVRDKMFSMGNVVLVYCRPPVEAMMRPDKHQWKDYDTEEDKQKILNNQMKYIEAYDAVMSRLPHICYDYTMRDTDEMVELVAMLAASQHDVEIIKKLKELERGYYGCGRI